MPMARLVAFLDETSAAQIALAWLVPGEVRRREGWMRRREIIAGLGGAAIFEAQFLYPKGYSRGHETR